MIPKIEIRAFDFEVKAAQDDRNGQYITGRPIVFNSRTDMGWYDEIIEAGALDDADLRDVRFLVNHNTDMIPLARSRNNNANSTMQLSVVPTDGMDIRVNLDTKNNADAKSLYSAVDRGDISGMSFMMTVDADRWDDVDSVHPTRRILKIRRVFEVSAVTWPAYAETSIQTRGLAGALESARASLDSARNAAHEEKRRRQKIRILSQI